MQQLVTTEPFGTYPPTRLQRYVRSIGATLPNNWLGLRFSGWLRALLQQTATAPVDVTVLGQRMRLRMGDNACERRLMVTPHFFDPNELMVLRQAMRPGFRFIDLGANVGAYTVFVGVAAGPGAKLLAIEPQRGLANRLRENLDLNGVEADVALVGVSDHDGETEFTIDTNNLGFTSLKGDRGGRGKKQVSSFPVRRLSGLVADYGFDRIDALKVDIEGAEDLALIPFIEDAPERLWPRIIILEPNASEWRRDCVAYLKARGYEEVYRGGNIVLRLP